MLLGKALKRRKGFGIVEVLVSAIVLGFLYLALLNLQVGNRKALLRIRGRDAAVEVAQQVLDSLQANGVTALPVANEGKPVVVDGLDYECPLWERVEVEGCHRCSQGGPFPGMEPVSPWLMFRGVAALSGHVLSP